MVANSGGGGGGGGVLLNNNFLLKRGVGLFSRVGLISGDYGTCT